MPRLVQGYSWTVVQPSLCFIAREGRQEENYKPAYYDLNASEAVQVVA